MAQPILFLVIFLHMISIFSQTNAFSMKMIPIDSPHLQILPQDITLEQRHQFLVNISTSRAYFFARKGESNLSPNAISYKLYRFPSSYYVTQLALGHGAGELTPYVLLDTGSEDTWVQCEGCNPCFEVKPKSFNYMASPSFARMSPHDSRCVPQHLYQGSCGYEIQYSQSRVVGVVGTETFAFINGRTKQLEWYPNIAFGCGLHNYNIEFGDNSGPNNFIAGIHGLAPGARSFLNQLDSNINGRFTYCIPSWTVPRLAMSTVNFGADAHISPSAKVIKMHAAKRYHLYLIGISVDGTRLAIDPSVFELDETRFTKGFFIDSGAPYTVLTKRAYNPLKYVMVMHFYKYGWVPHPGGVHGFDLCYTSYPKQDQRFPTVVLHFMAPGEGQEPVDMVLSPDNVFEKLTNTEGFCMMILPTDDPGPSLFGAFQQANFRYLYDVKNWLMFFTPENCVQSAVDRIG